MKKNILKFTVAVLAAVSSIAIVWASGVFQSLFSSSSNSSVPIAEIPVSGIKSGKIIVRFKEFYYGKMWSAYFEVINDTSNPVFYVGSKRGDSNSSDFCALAIRKKEDADSFSPFNMLNQ